MFQLGFGCLGGSCGSGVLAFAIGKAQGEKGAGEKGEGSFGGADGGVFIGERIWAAGGEVVEANRSVGGADVVKCDGSDFGGAEIEAPHPWLRIQGAIFGVVDACGAFDAGEFGVYSDYMLNMK